MASIYAAFLMIRKLRGRLKIRRASILNLLQDVRGKLLGFVETDGFDRYIFAYSPMAYPGRWGKIRFDTSQEYLSPLLPWLNAVQYSTLKNMSRPWYFARYINHQGNPRK